MEQIAHAKSCTLLFRMKSLFDKFIGGIAYLNGLCPKCWQEIYGGQERSCHVCRVAGMITPNHIWHRFITKK